MLITINSHIDSEDDDWNVANLKEKLQQVELHAKAFTAK
jgi:hypothetical protein